VVVIESGIIVSGVPIIYSTFHPKSDKGINIVIKSGLLSGFMMFAEKAFKNQSIEFIESGKYIIVFRKGKIQGTNCYLEPIIAYAIMDKKNKSDANRIKRISSLLSKILKKFVIENNGKNFSNINCFEYFAEFINNKLKIESETPEVKAQSFLLSFSKRD